jgi:hypothetical protein
MIRSVLFVLLLATGVAVAGDAPQPQPPAKDETKKKGEPDLGMSILGNQEAPKSLVIVPWKRSEIGNSHDFSTLLDDSRTPIDREVFMRVLSYYELRSEPTRHDGAPAGAATPPAGAAHRR